MTGPGDLRVFAPFAVALLDAVGIEPVGPVTETTLLVDELGFDSLHVVELLVFIDDHVEAVEPLPEPAALHTLGDAHHYYLELVRRAAPVADAW